MLLTKPLRNSNGSFSNYQLPVSVLFLFVTSPEESLGDQLRNQSRARSQLSRLSISLSPTWLRNFNYNVQRTVFNTNFGVIDRLKMRVKRLDAERSALVGLTWLRFLLRAIGFSVTPRLRRGHEGRRPCGLAERVGLQNLLLPLSLQRSDILPLYSRECSRKVEIACAKIFHCAT